MSTYVYFNDGLSWTVRSIILGKHLGNSQRHAKVGGHPLDLSLADIHTEDHLITDVSLVQWVVVIPLWMFDYEEGILCKRGRRASANSQSMTAIMRGECIGVYDYNVLGVKIAGTNGKFSSVERRVIQGRNEGGHEPCMAILVYLVQLE
jgi:hypothetical protein